MKLYIPTCTLNFNNILSSESISPLDFYARRGFGNKRFYPVCANDKKQVIILYSKYPRFEIEEYDLENYPMVIEIEKNDYKDGFFEKAMEHDRVETYLCYHTINLNPFHCRIYFNSYQERQGVLAKAEQSLENKFYKLYAANIAVKPEEKKTFFDVAKGLFTQSENDDFSWNSSYANCEIKSVSINVDQDILLDRIKGFIYCYLIGANSSVSNEVCKLKALSRKLRNTLSAVVNSPDKRPTQAQDDAILNGIEEFKKIYSSIDEDTIENKKSIESKLSANPLGLSTQDVKKLLEFLGLYDDFCNKQSLRRVYEADELRSCLENVSPETFSRVIDNMNSAIRKLEAKDNAQREKYAIEALLNVDDNLSLHILDTSYKSSFYEKLICSQFKAEYKSVMEEKGVEEPLAQAYNGGMILKKMLRDKWDSNPASTYVGALLNHFQENSAFDLFDIENEVLSSFAAFCQKGDSIDRLEDYLVQIGLSNYKLAYGIYGATRGFTSLPKTFTSVLINGNKDYYQSFASNVWRMLNGVEIKDAVLPKANPNTLKIEGSQLGTQSIENRTLSPKDFMNELVSIPRTKTINKKLKQANFAEDTNVYTKKELCEKIYKIVGNTLSKSQEDKIDKAIERIVTRQDSEIRYSNCQGKSSEECQKLRGNINSNGISTSKLSTQVPITGNRVTVSGASAGQCNLRPINLLFINDDNCWYSLRDMIPPPFQDVVYEDLRWFQKEYKKGEDSRYYKNASPDNPTSIDKYIKFLKRKDYSSKIPVEPIGECLKKKYVK